MATTWRNCIFRVIERNGIGIVWVAENRNRIGINTMNDQDYIRKAVKLADGWKIRSGMNLDIGSTLFINGPERYVNCLLHEPKQYILDALAAQLIRQCLKQERSFTLLKFGVRLRENSQHDSQTLTTSTSNNDWAMNTIKAIVIAKCLSDEKQAK